MIVTEIYKGQGLGNQLWCYVVTRAIAADRGLGFGIQHPENFKCNDFLRLDFGQPVCGGEGPEGGPPTVLPEGIQHYYKERRVLHPINGADISIHDDTLVKVPDNTKIDGNMQDEQYIIHRRDEIRQWLKVKEEYECYDYADDNICVMNFRGGEYTGITAVFLPQSYWDHAVANMRKINPNFRFVVITDDEKTAKKFFPHFEVRHFSIAKDYVIIKNAKYLVLANTSFAWFPAWLNENLKFCIAPKYWWSHNSSDGYWACGFNITSGWHYQDRSGLLHTYNSCLKELHEYEEKHKEYFISKEHDNTSVAFNYVGPKETHQYPTDVRHMTKYLVILLRRVLPQPIKSALWRFYRTKSAASFIAFLKKYRSRRNITALIHSALQKQLSASELAEYRKKIKLYDVFYFFNELELLEIRLNVLDPYVDYFVVIEATETFTGLPKKLFYQENRHRFKKYEHKIIHYVTRDTPADESDLRKRLYDKNISDLDKEIICNALTTDNVPKGETHWLKEFYQKESLKKALVGLAENDFVFVSDVDEIWNPEIKIDYSKDSLYKYKQVAYYYYVNNRSNDNWVTGWTGTVATKYKNIKHSCLNHLRTHTKNTYSVLKNGGWHFTFQGGAEQIKKKLASYGHKEFNVPEITSQLEEVIVQNRDYRGRNLKFWVDESKLPKYLLENKSKYSHLFR